MGKIPNTWSLMGSCWELLKKDKEILVFPFFSLISLILVIAAFVSPIMDGNNDIIQKLEKGEVMYYIYLFIFFYCNYFVIVFFNVAIIACASIRISGGDPTIIDGIREAFTRIHIIAGWAIISATVSLILRIIESRSQKAGAFVSDLLGTAWAFVSFLVIPSIVIANKGPIDALKESTQLLKKTWGEQLVHSFSFGLIFFLLSIPGIFVATLGGMNGNYIMIIVAVAYFVILALVQTALQAIFQTVIYLYSRDSIVPAAFSEDELAGCYRG